MTPETHILQLAEWYNTDGDLELLNDIAPVIDVVQCALDMPELNSPKLHRDVVLISGGMDSYIQYKLLKSDDKIAVFVDFPRKYAEQEWDVVSKLVPEAIKHKIDFNVTPANHIIPLRNMMLLNIASLYVQDGGIVHTGIVDGESGESGDKSLAFLNFWKVYQLQMFGKSIGINTLSRYTKNELLMNYLTRFKTHDVLDTLTCFSPVGDKHCGTCQACLRKFIALVYCAKEGIAYGMMPRIKDNPFVDTYIAKMDKAVRERDYAHYSKRRIDQDLPILKRIKI